MIFVSQFSDIQLCRWNIQLLDGLSNLYRIENRNGFSYKFACIFVQIKNLTDIFVNKLVSEKHQFNGFVIPKITHDLDKFYRGPPPIGLKSQFVFISSVQTHSIKRFSVLF